MSTLARHAASSRDRRSGRIGPNAIVRVAEVLPGWIGSAGAQALFDAAGLGQHWRAAPQDMVEEGDVARLHAQMRQHLGAVEAGRVAWQAGERTADYLLERRIPKAVQGLMKGLPAPLAARLLLSAIGRNAWTFAGSGGFSATAGRPCVLTIRNNPLCRGAAADARACAFYAATFERLFRVLVHAQARAVETACETRGDPACRFELRW